MKKEWYTATELAEFAIKEKLHNFPKTSRGVNKRALSENWEKHPRSSGQGGGFEFHYRSLPIDIQEKLGLVRYDYWVDPVQGAIDQMVIEEIKRQEQEKREIFEDLEKLHQEAILNSQLLYLQNLGFDADNLDKNERKIINHVRAIAIEDKENITKAILQLTKEEISFLQTLRKMSKSEQLVAMSLIKAFRKNIKQIYSDDTTDHLSDE